MNPTSYEKEAPVLSRDEAIAILNTPDEELEALIDRASSLRYKYRKEPRKHPYPYQCSQR